MSRHKRPSPDGSPCCVVRDGPTTFEELEQWAKEIVAEYKQAEVCLPSWLAHLKRLVVTSKWSGCGGMNFAVMKIIKALKDIHDIEIVVLCHNVCDNDGVCQGLPKTFNRQHMTSDLLDQYDSEVVSQIYHKMT